MRNNVSFNILASYAYLNNDKVFCDWCFGLHKDGIANVMIDSGAFTLHNAKRKRDWLTVDNYCRFLEKYGNNCEKYVMLDVVGNDIQSKKNYELMVSRGFEPMFVLTMFDKDWQYLNETLNTNQNICVAGGVTTKGDWMTKRFQDVSVHTNRRAKVHGLGYVTFPKMFQVPLVSVDSSSWKQAALCYGTLNYFTPQGVKGMPYKDILKKGGKCIPTALRQELDQIKVTPSLFIDKEQHKGDFSIESLASCVTFIKFQKYAKMHNRQLFLAVSGANDVKKLNYVYNNFNNLDYERYKQMSGRG